MSQEGVRSYGKLPSRQLQRVTYPGEIQLKGYNILLEDNQTFRTLLTLMIPAQQKHCQCKIPRGTICQAFVWDFLFVRHITAKPSNRFNSMNQPCRAQNIKIQHKHNKRCHFAKSSCLKISSKNWCMLGGNFFSACKKIWQLGNFYYFYAIF